MVKLCELALYGDLPALKRCGDVIRGTQDRITNSAKY